MRLKSQSKPDTPTSPANSTTKRRIKQDSENDAVVPKRSRLTAISECPPEDEMPISYINSSFCARPPHVFLSDSETDTLNQSQSSTEESSPSVPRVSLFTNNNIKSLQMSTNAVQKNNTQDAETVTVCSVAVRETTVIKHTIQVRKDHQLPIQRLLKPEEYEAIKASPKKQLPLSPIKSASILRRIPFSPIRNTLQQKENSSQTIPMHKSKAQVALFASPPPKSHSISSAQNGLQPFTSPILSKHLTSTPIRRSSPRKFLSPSQSTPIRSSPKTHVYTASPAAQLKHTPLRGCYSPRKCHLYTTPSPISSYRINSSRKTSLFAARFGAHSHTSPVKRSSPIKLFASPSNCKGMLAAPKSPQRNLLKELSPLKRSRSGENSEKLMGALALMELAGGL